MADTEKSSDTGAKTKKAAEVGHNGGVMATLDSLYKKQVEWDKTTFEGLVDLLGECLAVYYRLRKDDNGRKQLAEVLKALNLETKDGVHTATRVTRYVFRANNKRVTGYASIVRAAIDDEIFHRGFAAWVKTKGGLDQIRRTKKGAANGLTPRQMSEEAAKLLGQAAPVHVIRKPPQFLKTGDKALHGFAVALVRYNSQNGNAEIICGTDNAAVTRHLLTVMAKGVMGEAEKAEASAASVVNRAARKAAIHDVVSASGTTKAKLGEEA